MAEISLPTPIQLPQGTTVGLLILQSSSPISVPTSTNTTHLASVLSMTSIPTAVLQDNNNNNNNNRKVNNNNIKKGGSSRYQKPIKPAPANGGVTKRVSKKATGTSPPLKPPKKFRDEDNEILRCKRRLDFAKLGLPFNRANPAAVARRNERERRRVKQINSTFLALRDHLPNTYCQNKNPNKMSKVETLRGAIDYIHYLSDVLGDYQGLNTVFSSGCIAEVDISPNVSPEQLQTQTDNQASEAFQHMSNTLSVQAPDNFQSVQSINSPTGSTCSSVCSSTSSAGNVTVSDYYTMPTYNPLQNTLPYTSTVPDIGSASLEAELIDFASWF